MNCPHCGWDISAYSEYHRDQHVFLCSLSEEEVQKVMDHTTEDRYRDWRRYL